MKRIEKINRDYYMNFYRLLEERKIRYVPEIILRSKIIEKELKKEDFVLDVGCGTCYLLKNLKCIKKYGIDIVEPPFLKEVLKKGVVFIKKSISRIPEEIKNIKFDVIIFSHILEHLSDPYNILKKYLRLLKNHGKIIILLPINEPSLVHNNLMDVERILLILKKANFNIIIKTNLFFKLPNYTKKKMYIFLFNNYFSPLILPIIDRFLKMLKYPPHQYFIVAEK